MKRLAALVTTALRHLPPDKRYVVIQDVIYELEHALERLAIEADHE